MNWGPGLNQKEKASWALRFISVSCPWQQGVQMPPAPDTATSRHDRLDPPKLRGKNSSLHPGIVSDSYVVTLMRKLLLQLCRHGDSCTQR